MKKHLIKYIGDAETDYHTTTYCGLDSDFWSEKFYDNVDKTLTQISYECTCKRCIKSFNLTLEE